MHKPLTSSPRLRRALMKRIIDFGCGRVEVHTAVLEAVTNDAERASRLRAVLAEARDYVGKGYQPSGLLARIDAALR